MEFSGEKVVVVGSGPAGLSAALYAGRAGAGALVLEGLEPGGALTQAACVENYPGAEACSGKELVAVMRAQAERAGARFALDEVRAVDFSGGVNVLRTLMGDEIRARAVVVATGAGVTRTGLPGEAAFWGRGVSACLACDAALYKGRPVAVVGEGPAAAGARAYLARAGADVVDVLAPGEAAAFEGDGGTLRGVRRADGTVTACDGVFLVTARRARTAFLGGALELDAAGAVRVRGGAGETSVPGVFAAGDCCAGSFKQAVAAAAAGAAAGAAAAAWIFKEGV